MTRVFSILLIIFAVAVALALGGVAVVYYLASQSLPDYDRQFSVNGTSGRVEIVRDNRAVPHIFSEVENDVYFGLGFAHAQDRLWQMLMLRRTAQGRLSELFGADTLRVDELLRSLELYRVAQATATYQTPETLAILESYSAGVNARLAAIQQETQGRGAPELMLFKPAIAPWTPVDSIAVLKLLALQLSDKASVEVLQARLSLILAPERLADIFPREQGKPIMDLPDYASVFGADMPELAASEAPPDHPLYPIRPVGMAGASNAWAVMAKRSATGGTLLANDPHLSLTAPTIWMLARLQFPEGGVIGGTIPGIPSILVGRNQSFAWGVTTSYLDDQDFLIEKLNPDNPEEYLTPDGYKPFERRDVIIEVKDEPGVTVPVRRSRHGPIIPKRHWKLENILPSGHVAALSWTALEPNDRTIEGALRTMRSRSIAEARAALAITVAPAQNVVMADRDGIALQTTGRAPRRDPAHTSQGRIPAPGWLAQNSWQGFLPSSENPSVVNPESGVIANTNNRLVDREFPNHWSYDWGDDQRIQRAERMLNGREFHTLDSFIEIQTDTVSPSARSLLPLIGRDLWWSGQPAAQGTTDRLRQQALELLANWNGEMSEHDPEPLIYANWVRKLQRRLVIDEVGALSEDLIRLRPLFLERVYRDIDGASAWCDVVQTSRSEDCVEIARVSLDEALLELTETYGGRMESWRWGDAHQALHNHEVLGSLPLLRWFVNIRQDTPGGDNTLLRGQTLGRGAEPFLNVHAAGYRAIYDLADPEASVFVIATGQSGHFLSRHYDDFSQTWRRSEYVPMALDPVLARSGNEGVTVLMPRE